MLQDKRQWMVLFLTAAGCAERVIVDDGVQEQTEVLCDIAIACDVVSDPSECSDPPDLRCSRPNPPQLAQCIDDLERRLEVIEEASGNDRQDECFAPAPSSCNEAYVPNGRCGTGHPAEGRPLFDGDEMVLPAVEPAAVLATATDSGAHWLHAARTEYSSVAAFARLATELMALGAPMDLVARSHAAALDEVAHAQSCLALARRLLDADIELGPLPVVPARRDVSLADVAIESLVDGCIGEAFAAARAQQAALHARDDVATTLTTIAEDELRHAALAWSIVGWSLRRDPTLARELVAAVASWRAAATHALALEIVDEIVQPTLARLATPSYSASVSA